MDNKGMLPTSRLVFASPWLLAAAIGILILIVVTFAVNNLQREKRMMAENLRHKGQALVRFVGAGARVSLMMGRADGSQIQHLIEEATADKDIVYIAVVDGSGHVLAHSDAALVGHPLGRDMAVLQRLAGGNGFHVVTAAVDGRKNKVFEVVSPFNPFRAGLGRFLRRGGMMGGMMGFGRPGTGPSPDCPTMDGTTAGKGNGGSADWCSLLFARPGQAGFLVLVGLDMTDQEVVIRQGRLHLLAMSVVLLLVGVGGWLSLIVLQGYRVSQETLRQVQAFAGLLIGRLPVGIIATDGQGRIKTCNPAATVMLGKETTEAVGQVPEQVLPASLAELFTKPAEGEEWLNREMPLAGADHPPRTVRASSVPIVASGDEGRGGRVVLLHDVTELKGLERKIRRHEQLAALGKMAAGVAHEVRNPLSSIKGFATLLGSKFQDGTRERESARLLVNEVERLDRSITELLNYARPLPLRLAPLAVGEIVADSLKLVRADADALGVAVTAVVAPQLPPVTADRDRLSQVLLNLFLNGLQAMAKGGSLTVAAAPASEAGMVDIVVRDTGCGISPADLDRVFDPYFTTKAGGTGLGLAMVLKIVDEHHGTVRIASREGEGTTVTVTLPMAS